MSLSLCPCFVTLIVNIQNLAVHLASPVLYCNSAGGLLKGLGASHIAPYLGYDSEGNCVLFSPVLFEFPINNLRFYRSVLKPQMPSRHVSHLTLGNDNE